MIRLTPGGANSATSYALTYEIVEKLCKTYCTNATVQPAVTTTFTVSNTELVGTQLYATIQAVVGVTYLPKGARNTACGMVTNTYIENFTVSFAAATSASTVALTDTDGYTDPAYICTNNCNVANGIKNVGNLTITMS